jgi:hypothetical protein
LEVVRDWNRKSIKERVAPLGGDDIGQLGSTFCQVVKEEVWRHLPKTKLPGYYDRLVRLITRFDDPVRGAHANWKEAETDHNGI